jgi:nucleotide-binding universal stress UspA family protein
MGSLSHALEAGQQRPIRPESAARWVLSANLRRALTTYGNEKGGWSARLQVGQQNARSLSTHLANHGIKIGTDVLQIRTTEEHKSLRTQIEHGHYDLLVMGGYSHPMWLEFIFGGATRSILLSSKIPIFVSH